MSFPQPLAHWHSDGCFGRIRLSAGRGATARRGTVRAGRPGSTLAPRGAGGRDKRRLTAPVEPRLRLRHGWHALCTRRVRSRAVKTDDLPVADLAHAGQLRSHGVPARQGPGLGWCAPCLRGAESDRIGKSERHAAVTHRWLDRRGRPSRAFSAVRHTRWSARRIFRAFYITCSIKRKAGRETPQKSRKSTVSRNMSQRPASACRVLASLVARAATPQPQGSGKEVQGNECSRLSLSASLAAASPDSGSALFSAIQSMPSVTRSRTRLADFLTSPKHCQRDLDRCVRV